MQSEIIPLLRCPATGAPLYLDAKRRAWGEHMRTLGGTAIIVAERAGWTMPTPLHTT